VQADPWDAAQMQGNGHMWDYAANRDNINAQMALANSNAQSRIALQKLAGEQGMGMQKELYNESGGDINRENMLGESKARKAMLDQQLEQMRRAQTAQNGAIDPAFTPKSTKGKQAAAMAAMNGLGLGMQQSAAKAADLQETENNLTDQVPLVDAQLQKLGNLEKEGHQGWANMASWMPGPAIDSDYVPDIKQTASSLAEQFRKMEDAYTELTGSRDTAKAKVRGILQAHLPADFNSKTGAGNYRHPEMQRLLAQYGIGTDNPGAMGGRNMLDIMPSQDALQTIDKYNPVANLRRALGGS
jgi:uncharacterized phage infection (PIP) family protein YhgE